MQELQNLQNKIGDWSEEINPNQTLESLLEHLVEEAEDLLKEPYNPMSYADIVILLLAAARKANYTVEELIQATEAKFTLNQSRIWLKPDEKGIVRHSVSEHNEE